MTRLLVLFLLLTSHHVFAQSYYDPWDEKPKLGGNCPAINEAQAADYIAFEALAEMAYAAKKAGCKGWNISPAKEQDFDLFAHNVVLSCYGEPAATKILKQLKSNAQDMVRMGCSHPDTLKNQNRYIGIANR